MDYFCKECASYPGWPWDDKKGFMYSCQRCFRFLPCNDYEWRKPESKVEPAPKPKDLVRENINAQSECKLPPAEVPAPPVPQPVYKVPAPSADGRTEVDKALDAVQPNRPGIKLEVKKK